MTKREYTVPLRIVVVAPPPGINHCLEVEDGQLVSVIRSSGDDLAFDFDVTVTENRRNGAPNFIGPFSRGTPSKRFFYVNIGTLAGQSESEWDRSAKIFISDVPWSTIESVVADPNKVLMARYSGTTARGEPSCATVTLLDGGWIITDKLHAK